MRLFFFTSLLFLAACHHSTSNLEPLALIQIQDRNGVTETISNPDRLMVYETVNFCSSQPYQKVLRIYKKEGKNRSKITTYHPNGTVFQYLEAEEMRAHGAYREWYPNGQLKIEANVIGGTADVSAGSQQDWLFDSLSQVWDEQGHLLAQIPYQKGVLEGSSLYFYPSGALEKEVPFVQNHLEGEVLEYAPNGELKSKTRYQKGQKQGESCGFFPQGQIAWEEKYVDGYLKEGTYYNQQGEKISGVENGGGFQALFDGGTLTQTEFRFGYPEGIVRQLSASGEVQRIFHVKGGKKEGEEIEYYPSSGLSQGKPVPKLSVQWHENKIHGTVKTWYDNGQLCSQRDYSHTLRTGPSLAWYRDGSLMLVEEYEEEKLLNGQYFKLHKTEPVSTVLNGNGLATLYDETGALLRKVPYSKGKPFDPEN